MDKLDLANKGADVAGSLVSAGVGLTIAGPVGAIGGAAIGPIITNAFKDIAARMLSPREKVRLDNAVEYIAAGIEESLKSGKIVRQDDFFVGSANYSSNGMELLEGVLLKCKAEYQGKKVLLIANIFKNTAFDATVFAETAYHVLNLAEQLSYHELCLLSFFGRKDDYTGTKREFSNFNTYNTSLHNGPSALTDGIGGWERMQDLMAMYRLGLLKDKLGNTHLTASTLNPDYLVLDKHGQTVFDLLDLSIIHKEDIFPIIQPLGVNTATK